MELIAIKNHLFLPHRCKKCGEKNEYWLDGTFGCINGHIVASKLDKEFSLYYWGDVRKMKEDDN